MKNLIIEKAEKIARQYDEESLAKAQEILMNYLKDNARDTQAWLLLIRIECNPWFDDYDRIVHYVNHILSYDLSNAYALLFWAYANHYFRWDSNDGLYEKLCMAYNDDPKIMAMIEIAKARYLMDKDPAMSEAALKKSIEYCPDFARNFYMLGELYIKQGKNIEGHTLIRQAFKNVKRWIGDGKPSQYDPESIEGFLAEFFAGTTMIRP